VLLKESHVEAKLQKEMEELKTKGYFIPLLRPRPLKALVRDPSHLPLLGLSTPKSQPLPAPAAAAATAVREKGQTSSSTLSMTGTGKNGEYCYGMPRQDSGSTDDYGDMDRYDEDSEEPVVYELEEDQEGESLSLSVSEASVGSGKVKSPTSPNGDSNLAKTCIPGYQEEADLTGIKTLSPPTSPPMNTTNNSTASTMSMPAPLKIESHPPQLDINDADTTGAVASPSKNLYISPTSAVGATPASPSEPVAFTAVSPLSTNSEVSQQYTFDTFEQYSEADPKSLSPSCLPFAASLSPKFRSPKKLLPSSPSSKSQVSVASKKNAGMVVVDSSSHLNENTEDAIASPSHPPPAAAVRSPKMTGVSEVKGESSDPPMISPKPGAVLSPERGSGGGGGGMISPAILEGLPSFSSSASISASISNPLSVSPSRSLQYDDVSPTPPMVNSPTKSEFEELMGFADTDFDEVCSMDADPSPRKKRETKRLYKYPDGYGDSVYDVDLSASTTGMSLYDITKSPTRPIQPSFMSTEIFNIPLHTTTTFPPHHDPSTQPPLASTDMFNIPLNTTSTYTTTFSPHVDHPTPASPMPSLAFLIHAAAERQGLLEPEVDHSHNPTTTATTTTTTTTTTTSSPHSTTSATTTTNPTHAAIATTAASTDASSSLPPLPTITVDACTSPTPHTTTSPPYPTPEATTTTTTATTTTSPNAKAPESKAAKKKRRRGLWSCCMKVSVADGKGE